MPLHNPARLRARIRAALCHMGRRAGVVYRPDRDEYGNALDTRTPIGGVAGYPYLKARGLTSVVIELAGRLDEDDRTGECLMVLYGSREGEEPGDAYDPPDTQKGDLLVMDAKTYRVLSVRDGMGVYQLYQIKEA